MLPQTGALPSPQSNAGPQSTTGTSLKSGARAAGQQAGQNADAATTPAEELVGAEGTGLAFAMLVEQPQQQTEPMSRTGGAFSPTDPGQSIARLPAESATLRTGVLTSDGMLEGLSSPMDRAAVNHPPTVKPIQPGPLQHVAAIEAEEPAPTRAQSAALGNAAQKGGAAQVVNASGGATSEAASSNDTAKSANSGKASLSAVSGAPAMTPTGPSDTAATAATSRVEAPPTAQLAREVKALARQGGDRLDFTLHPEELGRVSITMRRSATHTEVRVVVERPQALEALRNGLQLLPQAIAEVSNDLQGKDVRVSLSAQGDAGGDARHAFDGQSEERGARSDRQATSRDTAQSAALERETTQPPADDGIIL